MRLLSQGVRENDHRGWLDTLKGIFADLTEGDRQQAGNPSYPTRPFRRMRRLRQAAGDGSIYAVDGGGTVCYAVMALRAKEKAGAILNGLQFGCLGIGVPFAIAAKPARPEKRVIVVSGDGSFGLNAMGFDAARRHGVPIVCAVGDGRAWGSAKHSQELCCDVDRVCGTGLGRRTTSGWSKPWAVTGSSSPGTRRSCRPSKGPCDRASPLA